MAKGMDKEVSATTFEPGSVMQFYPDRGMVKLNIEQQPTDPEVVIVGWALVVMERDMWVVKTELEPVGNCPECDIAGPVITHLLKVHDLESFWTT